MIAVSEVLVNTPVDAPSEYTALVTPPNTVMLPLPIAVTIPLVVLAYTAWDWVSARLRKVANWARVTSPCGLNRFPLRPLVRPRSIAAFMYPRLSAEILESSAKPEGSLAAAWASEVLPSARTSNSATHSRVALRLPQAVLELSDADSVTLSSRLFWKASTT
ncbi:hypothetical protein D3C73_1194280 [compost metagenome]